MAGVLFFGTPELAVPSLEALCAAGMAPTLVITRPDRPVGRGQQLASPPVALAARRLGLELRQPERIRDPAFLAELALHQPEVAVVVAYGRIFPSELLGLPRRGCVNLHASLLPRHRGASPIQAAILAGDAETGVCLMLMEAGLDTGPVIACRSTPIGPQETAGELGPRLASLGAELLAERLPAWIGGELVAVAQDHDRATIAPLVKKEDGRVDWNQEATFLARCQRAYSPWPGLWAELGGAPVKLLEVRPTATASAATPGTVVALSPEHIEVACGRGSVLGIARLQRPGRRGVSAREFLNAESLAVGDRLG